MPNKNALITHTQGKGFVERAWNTISETGWDQCTLADPTYMHGRFKSWKIPKSCELYVLQDFVTYLMTL